MIIQNLDRKFLEKIRENFWCYGYDGTTYEQVGKIFADYFLDTLIKAYEQDPDTFIFLQNISTLD